LDNFFVYGILKVFQNGQLSRLQSYKLFSDYVSLQLQKNYKKNVPTSDTFFSLQIPLSAVFTQLQRYQATTLKLLQ